MKYDKAIREVKSLVEVLKETFGEADTTDIFFDKGDEVAYEMAMQALEKQIPKKPILKNEFWGKYWACPNCNRHVEDIIRRYRYCDECGQRIDW